MKNKKGSHIVVMCLICMLGLFITSGCGGCSNCSSKCLGGMGACTTKMLCAGCVTNIRLFDCIVAPFCTGCYDGLGQ